MCCDTEDEREGECRADAGIAMDSAALSLNEGGGDGDEREEGTKAGSCVCLPDDRDEEREGGERPASPPSVACVSLFGSALSVALPLPLPLLVLVLETLVLNRLDLPSRMALMLR